MVSRLPLYREVRPAEEVDAYLERDGVHVPLQLWVDTTDAEDAHLRTPAAALDPGAVVEQPLANDMRDVPAAVARRATFTVPIAREDKVIDRRVTPSAGATIAAVEAARTAMPNEKTRATIAVISSAIAAVSPWSKPLSAQRQSARDH